MEEWKDIKDYEGLYQISNLGRIKSLKRYKKNHSKTQMIEEKILLPHSTRTGYICVCLCKDAKPKQKTIHRLVAEAFIPNPENKEEVNHIDGDKTNNRVENLEWCTRCENIQHSFKNGFHKLSSERIEKLMKSCIKKVNQYSKQGEFIKTWESIAQAGRELNINHASISACCKGKLKTSGKYIWEYADK